MENFYTELGNGIRNAFCSSLELQQNYYGYLGGNNRFAVAAQLAEQFFGTAYRIACNREPPDPPEPPFEGGQCPVNYGVVVTYNVAYDNATDVNGVQTPLTGVLGPIQNIRLRPIPNESNPSGCAVEITAAIGTFDLGSYSQGGNPGFNAGDSTFSVYLYRGDGQPDNCGNPPTDPVEPEPGFNNTDIDITYTNNDGNDVTLPVTFIYGTANINLDGEFTIPVRLDFSGADLQIGGDLNLSTGAIDLNFGNPNFNRNGLPNPDGYQPDPSIPDAPDDVPTNSPNPPLDSSEGSTTRILRACIVTTVTVPDGITSIFQDDNPTIFAPNLGYVQFAILVNGVLSWTGDIAIKNKRHFVPCPWEGGAVEVRGTPRPGVIWTITPVYALVEEAVEFA